MRGISPTAATLITLAVTAAAGSAPAHGTPIAGFEETTVVDSLSRPTAIAFLPDGRMLVTEQDGDLRLVSGGTASLLVTIPAGFCDSPDLDYETGLLGVAVDPDFSQNGFIYLYRTHENTPNSCDTTQYANQVVRVTMAENDTIDPASLTVLLDSIKVVSGDHNAGCLRIGPDGKLYVSTGDTGEGDFGGGGPGSSTNPYAQDLDELEGKILRLDFDGGIPQDNPFRGQAGKRGEVFAYGFRNPWRFAFDPETKKLWVGDVGEEDLEEIDIVASGKDYSWPYCEGDEPDGCARSGDVAPVFTYPHSGVTSLGFAIMGGGFAPPGFGALGGEYVFGDYVSGTVYHAPLNVARTQLAATPALFLDQAGGPVDLVFGPDGALYYAALDAGEIRRVAPASGGDELLSGAKLVIKGMVKKALSILSKDPSITVGIGDDDPTLQGGTLRVAGGDFDTTYFLPIGGWTAVNGKNGLTGYKYAASITSGPITKIQITNGKLLKVIGRGERLGSTPGFSDPSPVDIVLTTGTRRFCMTFGGTAHYQRTRQLTSTGAPPPAACHD